MIRLFSPFALRRAAAALLVSVPLFTPLRADNNPREALSPGTAGFLERARLMADGGNYAGAIDQLLQITQSDRVLGLAPKEECLWLLAKAYYESGREDCVEWLGRFAADYPASARAVEARLLIGDYYFFSHEFGAACEAYACVPFAGLNTADRNKYTYRLALSELKTGQYEKADVGMKSLLGNAEYGAAARFYRAYIEYATGSRAKAREGFLAAQKELRGSRRQAGLPSELDASYYLAQIDFADGDYEQAAATASKLLKSDGIPADFIAEMRRIAGESRFKLGDYDAALPYLSAYEATPGITHLPSAEYALGAILYADGRRDEAADLFGRISDQNDEIGQGALLYLGQCAAADGDNSAAAISFEKAYRMGYDKKVAETALFNYMAARSEGGRIPFSSSISMLEDFLESFPKSKYAPQVEESLATAYYNEKNYAKALESIDRIPDPSASVLSAKQKVVYELGIAAMSSDRPKEAAAYMEQAVELARHDRDLALQARLWLGDARYAEGNYAAAAKCYTEFLKSAKGSANRSLAFYDLGYSLYMQEKYSEALKRFREAESARPALAAALKADAAVRVADCLYYTGNMHEALKKYSEAESLGSADADYVALRKAVVTGLTGDNAAKIRLLNAMISAYPESKWLPVARLELARAYAAAGDLDSAADTYRLLAKTSPSSPEARKGMLRLGLLYSESGNEDSAAEALRYVISTWPTSEEAQSANEDLRRIYAAKGELAAYAAFLNSVPGAPAVDTDEIEKIAFEDADDALAADPKASARMKKYIEDYPDGKYLAAALNSLVIAAESLSKNREALEYSEALLEKRPDSQYAPAALLMKATIIESDYPARSAEAVAAWRKLAESGGTDLLPQAQSGIMRLTDSPSERLRYAEKLTATGGLSAEEADEAAYYRAKALADLGRAEEAEAAYKKLTSNYSGIYGAKAAVDLAQSYIAAKRYDKAEKLLLDFTDKGTPYEYWLARGFLLLADTYKAKGKTWLALEYVRSLKENYPGDEADINKMINDRLSAWK